LDNSLSETAFKSVTIGNAFNMTMSEAKQIAAVIGCDYFLIVRTGSLRRSSFEKAEYYEAFEVLYLVSGRTGRLSFWDLRSVESNSKMEAEKLLLKSAEAVSLNIAGKMTKAVKFEIAEKASTYIEEVPPENSPPDKTFRPPMPYKRIKPDYTRTAYLYDAKGTVDILVDINQHGEVMRTEIVRWAGFGLDEAVDEAVRKMNWRPAERGGKALPMRVLLRYNFTKIEKE
ncbi:MAG: energy transducer TonB, partial [Pyrinomonadaceae bacterium]